MLKKLSCLLFAIAMVLTVLTVPMTSAGVDGMTFSANDFYSMKAPFSQAPSTYEAVIRLPESVSGRGGVIVGNYLNGSTQCVSFEINNNGVPRFFALLGNGSLVQTDIKFSNVDVRTGDWAHLAIVLDTAKSKAYCYLNGELKETKSLTTFSPEAIKNPCYVGGDMRSGNAQYFKGNIKSVAVFSDMRTADEIKQDAKSMPTTDSSMLVSYDLVSGLNDLSGKGNDLLLNGVQDFGEELAAKGGFTFTDNDMYLTSEGLEKAPVTFEAKLYVPKGMSGRSGVIFGNYGHIKACISFELYTNGTPRLYYMDSEGTVSNFTFSNVDVRTGDWAHLAIVHDTSNKNVKCYLNGVLSQTVTADNVPAFDEAAYNKQIGVGCDLRNANERFFTGALSSVTIYSDIRSEAEIKADMTGVDTTDKDLLIHYDLKSAEKGNDVQDGSSFDNDLIFGERWFEEKAPVTDYEYSFCVVGDTQKVMYDDVTNGKNNIDKLYDWIVNNIDDKKIEYVFGLGDVTDKDLDSEWALARKNIMKLDSLVPFSVVRGNHDSSAKLNKNFVYYNYMKQFDGFYEQNKIENTWRTITVGDVDYLMMTLDYGASDKVLDWASEVIAEHPDHRVIITTHAYLYRDGTTLDQNDVCPPATTGGSNNGDHMWDKLISKHENIFLVMSGHDPCDSVIVTQNKGENGNIVTQMLIDPQGIDAREGSTGMITMLYFGNDGKTVTVETYSTSNEMYHMPTNQMVIEVPEYVSQKDQGDDKDTDTDAETDPETNSESESDTYIDIPIDTFVINTETEGAVSTDDGETNSGEGKPVKVGAVVITIIAVVAAAAVVAGVVVIVTVLKKKK